MNNLTECEINEVGKMFDDQLNAFEAPDGERISPLGAANDQDDDCISMLQDELGQLPSFQNECERIKSLEQEQEILTQSLLALTTHFAQVQFRLRQIVAAPQDERDNLLTNLEEFAFQGIPEMQNLNPLEKSSETKTAAAHKYRHDELIEQLKAQLDDLEQYAFENGDIVLPQSILVKKQQIIIDELKTKLNLNFDEFDMKHLSSDIIKNHVDTALGEIVNPLKMKEQLVTQLKTQINDLERFICFLQNGSNEIDGNDLKEVKKKGKTKGFDDCKCPVKDGESGKLGRETGAGKIKRNERADTSTTFRYGDANSDHLNNRAYGILSKTSALLQIFAATQLGCGSNGFQRNTLKKTTKGNHWGDIRAQLEVDIEEILAIAQQYNYIQTSSTGKKRSEKFYSINYELTSLVRKRFAMTLKKLIQHGLINSTESNSIVPFMGCFAAASSPRNYSDQQSGSDTEPEENNSGVEFEDDETYDNNLMHPWEFIMEYYHLKNGEKYNETPARKLSQSFNLEIVGSAAISNKQSLLSAIGAIIALHGPFKRSKNAHFKAFICSGLNTQKLVQWFNLLFQCTELIRMYYTEWSYISSTGFRDALRSMERLNRYNFDLPVDLAIRQFQNIKDVFM